MTDEELLLLRSQIATSKAAVGSGGRRYNPYAYTEQRIAMLSAVLRSDKAIAVSISIMNTFVEMRHFIANNALMFERIRQGKALKPLTLLGVYVMIIST